MLKDYVDITDFIQNSDLESDEDLLKIEEMQLQTTQNNILVRTLSLEDLSHTVKDNPTQILNKALLEKEKHVNRLEHELKIMSKSKRRTASKYRKLRNGSQRLGDNIAQEESDKKSAFSTRQIPKIPGLLEKPKLQFSEDKKITEKSLNGYYDKLSLKEELDG
eukprot:CAMPEP_0205799720 /NCGR_PEP_ID=MMETSP0205-20121125/1112_1 /ASSEMBLY_ACC=CAM_ASM_000278 /TAXON_ID=36767 /ORGANISM="Euplotes focardii, Strain TN1" /LENGTH=162 /DNA_ID=CAMNT_0053061557 /DNA_START=57 /DNA_END=542 /DNA_ORIENTATION=+